ncbi:MAG: N-acetyltransferase [Candidatus Marinimicrobia bacterium]|nr:N-acetyltransferase [Candidatus Neomarinimicrobiota bacterium]
MDLEFTALTEQDYPLVKEIYDHYILHSTATFHTEPLTIAELREMIPAGHPRYRSFLIHCDGAVCGFCYFAPYKKRPAYDRSAELTLYLKPAFTRRGIGRLALERLEILARESGIKVLLGIISGENVESIRLFEAGGFHACAHFREVGEKFGRVLDVMGYEKILDPTE